MTPARRAALGLALAVLGALATRPGHLARAAPAPQLGFPPNRVDPVFLPALGPPATELPGSCGARVAIQNVGDVSTRALVIGWGDPGTCVPSACRPATAILCTGLIAPGRAWVVDAGAGGTALTSAVVLSMTGAACDGLAAWPELRGCQGYARLRAAWDAGGVLGGVDLGTAYGAPLAVDVTRDCTDPDDKSRRVMAAYAGVSGSRFGGYDRVFDVATHAAVVVRGEGDGGGTTLHIQNGGARCASVEVWFQARGACQLQRLCAVTSQLPPGGTFDQPMAGCAPPGTIGTAWVVSSEPPAVAIDMAYRGALASYTAIPADLRRRFEGPPVFTAGSDRLVAPLTWPDEAVTATLHVQNLAARDGATIRVVALGARQALATTSICPRGAVSFDLRQWPAGGHAASAPVAGGLRVESVARFDAAGKRVPPPNLSAVLELRSAGGDATAYALAPVARLVGEDGSPGGTSRVAQALAVPIVARAADDAVGTSTRLAVASLVREPVNGRYLLGLFDANGLVDVTCRPIADVADIVDLAGYGAVGADFRGTALISAVAWVAADGGAPARPGLAATALQRPWHAATGPRGDGWRAIEAVPLAVGGNHALAGLGADCAAAARLDAPPAAPRPWLVWLPACSAGGGG